MSKDLARINAYDDKTERHLYVDTINNPIKETIKKTTFEERKRAAYELFSIPDQLEF